VKPAGRIAAGSGHSPKKRASAMTAISREKQRRFFIRERVWPNRNPLKKRALFTPISTPYRGGGSIVPNSYSHPVAVNINQGTRPVAVSVSPQNILRSVEYF
jgi:hypothetical protein